MPAYTTAHLQAMALGIGVPHEVFIVILSDPEAMRQFHELRRIASLFEDDPEPLEPLDTDVTLEELASHLEGQLHDPVRRTVVEAFLDKEFPVGGWGENGERG